MSEPRNRIGSTSVVFPLLLIGFGTLMLLKLWLPHFYPWGVLGKYWPLLIIFIGAGMIWDRTRFQAGSPESRPFPIGTTLGTLVFLGLMAILIFRDHTYYPRSTHRASSHSRNRATSRSFAKTSPRKTVC